MLDTLVASGYTKENKGLNTLLIQELSWEMETRVFPQPGILVKDSHFPSTKYQNGQV